MEYISDDNTYVISDERQQRLIKVHVDDDTQFLDAAEAEQMTSACTWAATRASSLAYDSVGKRLFVCATRC